jgi:acetylglutamate kinase
MSKPSLTLVKIGGNVIDQPSLLEKFISDFSKIEGHKVLVHGGGKVASELSRQMGIEPVMVNGRRVTDIDTLRIVTMVYGGLINKNLVAMLQAKGCNAAGLTGADGNTIQAHKRIHPEINFGFVGDIDEVNTLLINSLIHAGITPVVAPLTHDLHGHILNTNADTIAAELAVALSDTYEVQFFYCFEKKGLLMDIEDDDSVIKNVYPEDIDALKSKGVIAAGMIPKVDNIADAITRGVEKVVLCNAEDITTIIAGNSHFGTIFTK